MSVFGAVLYLVTKDIRQGERQRSEVNNLITEALTHHKRQRMTKSSCLLGDITTKHAF